MTARSTRRIELIVCAVAVAAIVVVVAAFASDVHDAEIETFHFYGNLSINGTPAPAHTTILASIGDETCGATEIAVAGTYDLRVFARPDPGSECYISFRIKTPSMESAVAADQKRTVPQTNECLFDLTVAKMASGTDSDLSSNHNSDHTVLHTGVHAKADPAASATPCISAAAAQEPVGEYDPMLWDVVINEVMWDEKEYIELYNTYSRTLSIANWTITTGAGAVNDTIEVTIRTDAIIPSHGHYLISKNDAVTCKPDQISNMTLKNDGEVLQLFNGYPPTSKRIDVVNRNGDWFAGRNDDVGQSMERLSIEDGANQDNWYTSLGYECGRIGTPGMENSIPDRTPPEITLVNDPIGVNNDIVVSFNEKIDALTLRITVVGPYGGGVSGRIIHDRDRKGAHFEPDGPLRIGVHLVRVTCRDPSDNFADQELLLTVADPDVGDDAGEHEPSPTQSPSPTPSPSPTSTATPAPTPSPTSTSTPAPTPTPTPMPVQTPSPTPAPAPVVKIVVNELMPDPIGTDHGNETTELYNCGDESVDLGGWVLKNQGTGIHEIPAGTVIQPHGYYTTTELQLRNNDGQVFLYHDGEEVDRSINYAKSTTGKSWQRLTDGLDTDSDSDWVKRDHTFGVPG